MDRKKYVEIMGFFPSGSLKQKTQFHGRQPHVIAFVRSVRNCKVYTRGVFAKPRNNRRSSKPRVQVLPAGEEVARKRSEGKKHASNGGRERDEENKEKEGGDEKKRRTTKTGRRR